MLRRILMLSSLLGLAGLLLVGCNPDKDHNNEEIKPHGTPNPNVPKLNAGGSSGAGGSAPTGAAAGTNKISE